MVLECFGTGCRRFSTGVVRTRAGRLRRAVVFHISNLGLTPFY